MPLHPKHPSFSYLGRLIYDRESGPLPAVTPQTTPAVVLFPPSPALFFPLNPYHSARVPSLRTRSFRHISYFGHRAGNTFTASYRFLIAAILSSWHRRECTHRKGLLGWWSHRSRLNTPLSALGILQRGRTRGPFENLVARSPICLPPPACGPRIPSPNTAIRRGQGKERPVFLAIPHGFTNYEKHALEILQSTPNTIRLC